MSEHDERRAWLVLARTPGLGPAGLRSLVAACNRSAAQVLQTPLARLARVQPLDARARAWLAAPDAARVDADLAWLAAPGHHLLRFVDADFPPQLEHVDQPPAVLFVVGDPGLLLHPQVAIVGARRATAQGLADSRAFAGQLAALGLVVTSGLADGVDGAAHGAALDAGGRTVAVLGTGADLVYPRKHAALARRIAEEGALVSEFPLGTGAHAQHFPRRNRLIAGLSLGTLVVEADLRSGSLITARLASEQGREVMALPGSIHNAVKRGCHRLIRDGATLVETPADVREVLAGPAQRLGGELAARLAAVDNAVAGRDDASGVGADDPDQARVLAALGSDPQDAEVLAERSNLAIAQVSSTLLELELAGCVARLPGGRYQRVVERRA